MLIVYKIDVAPPYLEEDTTARFFSNQSLNPEN